MATTDCCTAQRLPTRGSNASFIQPRHVMPVYWVLAFVHGYGRKFSGQPHWAISCQLAESRAFVKGFGTGT